MSIKQNHFIVLVISLWLLRQSVRKLILSPGVVQVMAAASDKLTPVTLELGGKDAFVVCEDADLKQVGMSPAGAACMGLDCIITGSRSTRQPFGLFVEGASLYVEFGQTVLASVLHLLCLLIALNFMQVIVSAMNKSAHPLPLSLRRKLAVWPWSEHDAAFQCQMPSMCSLSQVVPIAIKAAFLNLGQNCASGERYIIHSRIYDDFVNQAVEVASSMRQGPGLGQGKPYQCVCNSDSHSYCDSMLGGILEQNPQL